MAIQVNKGQRMDAIRSREQYFREHGEELRDEEIFAFRIRDRGGRATPGRGS